MSARRAELAMIFPGMGPTDFAEVGKYMMINAYAKDLPAPADDILGTMAATNQLLA
ncbi:hypothetical protein [Actinomadura sp. 9N215]|uniref:hypothetical protein n=1 Tax=Actinomadura sp. 9N215 TaxID=3375150 RepID=UPI0037960B75